MSKPHKKRHLLHSAHPGVPPCQPLSLGRIGAHWCRVLLIASLVVPTRTSVLPVRNFACVPAWCHKPKHHYGLRLYLRSVCRLTPLMHSAKKRRLLPPRHIRPHRSLFHLSRRISPAALLVPNIA